MNRTRYTVEKMCKVLGTSRSAYYRWIKGGCIRPKAKKAIDNRIQEIYTTSKSTYGSPRIHQELKQCGMQISQSTVARSMQRQGLQARPRRKFIHTTDSVHDYKVFENILNRNFAAERINEKWVSDITYIPTQKGWTYLTTILDLADRMIVGWTLSSDMSARTTSTEAFKIALQRRKVNRKLLLHSDRGVQYCCAEFRQTIEQSKLVEQSMSRKGNCWDNAPAESFFKTLKTELVNKNEYKNFEEAKNSIFDYIEKWYNPHRKHSTLGYMSPKKKYLSLIQTAS